MAYPYPNVTDMKSWWDYLDLVTFNAHSWAFLIVVFFVAFFTAGGYANLEPKKAFLAASFVTSIAGFGIWTLGSMDFKWAMLPVLLLAGAIIINKPREV